MRTASGWPSHNERTSVGSSGKFTSRAADPCFTKRGRAACALQTELRRDCASGGGSLQLRVHRAGRKPHNGSIAAGLECFRDGSTVVMMMSKGFRDKSVGCHHRIVCSDLRYTGRHKSCTLLEGRPPDRVVRYRFSSTHEKHKKRAYLLGLIWGMMMMMIKASSRTRYVGVHWSARFVRWMSKASALGTAPECRTSIRLAAASRHPHMG